MPRITFTQAGENWLWKFGNIKITCAPAQPERCEITVERIENLLDRWFWRPLGWVSVDIFNTFVLSKQHAYPIAATAKRSSETGRLTYFIRALISNEGLIDQCKKLDTLALEIAKAAGINDIEALELINSERKKATSRAANSPIDCPVSQQLPQWLQYDLNLNIFTATVSSDRDTTPCYHSRIELFQQQQRMGPDPVRSLATPCFDARVHQRVSTSLSPEAFQLPAYAFSDPD